MSPHPCPQLYRPQGYEALSLGPSIFLWRRPPALSFCVKVAECRPGVIWVSCGCGQFLHLPEGTSRPTGANARTQRNSVLGSPSSSSSCFPTLYSCRSLSRRKRRDCWGLSLGAVQISQGSLGSCRR